jgi:hypothetical protein
MSTDSKIRIADLDFDSIKAGLRTYISEKDGFTDHNFSASALSTLLDILSYNTHYQALLANYTANEMFLDTAQKRSSIVSRAKELGYTPYSTKSAKATINMVVSSVFGNPSSIVIPAGTQMISSVGENDMIFSTIKAYSASNSNNEFSFSDIEIYEGIWVQNTFTVNSSIPFLSIPNLTIDTTTLTVLVRENFSDDYVEYEYAPTVLDLKPDTKAFFIQESYSGEYAIYFGDGVIGYKPIDGASVIARYIVSNGALGNEAAVFEFSSSVPGLENSTKTIETVIAATGGGQRESIQSIKKNSVNYYGTQNRAVIVDDYKALLNYTGVNIKSAIAWGGEDNIPPRYNTVFFSVQPTYGDVLTPSDQQLIVDFFKKKSVGNMQFSFVDPDYIDILVDTVISYDKNNLVGSIFSLESAIRANIEQYITETVSEYNGTLYYSQLSKFIDQQDASIISSETKISLVKAIIPVLYTLYEMKFSFANALDKQYVTPAITSSGFYIEGNNNILYLEDDRTGKLRTVYYVGSEKIVLNTNAGTVNYLNGDVYVNPLKVTATVEESIYIYAKPASQNIYSKQRIIPRIESKNIKVSSKAAR